MNNRIELLLQAVLSKDSTTTIKNQVKELQQQLDSLKLDSKLVEQLKEVENLKINVDSKEFTKLSKELQQSQDAVDKLKEKSKELNEVAKQVSFKIDDKTFLRDFDALKKHVEERGGKLDFTIETDGARKEITKLSATFDEFGKKTTEVFKKAEVNGAIVWDVSKINHHDSKVRDTTRAYEELSNALTKMGRDGKITHEQMQRLTKELESSKGSHEAIAKINDELVKLSQSNANIEKLNKSLKSLYEQGNITKHQFEQLNETINKGTIDGKQYKYLEQQMNELSRAHKQRVKDIVDEIKETERLKNANIELQDVMAKLIRNAQHKPKMTQDENYSKTINELNQLDNLLKKGQISSAEFSARLKQVNSDLNVMSAKATETGRTQIGIIDSFKIAMEKFPVWMAATTLFYGTIRTAREFMGVIVDIDTKMTDLRKVMADGTDFTQVFDDATESAKTFGQTISDTMDAYIEFARQGFEGDQLKDLADAALVLSNVSEFNTSDAAGFLTSALVQYNKEATEAMDITDKWNEIGNNFATTATAVAEGVAKSGSVARAMNVEFEELNALVAQLTASTKQSGAEIGNAIKAILPRLTSAPAKKALESINVELLDAQGNMRNVIDIYRDAGIAIQDLDAKEKSMVAEGLGGKFHISRVLSLLDDLAKVDSMYDQIMESQANATNSAIEENEEYLKSFEARLAGARREVETLALALGDAFLSESMVTGIQLFSSGLGVITSFVEKFGALPVLLASTAGLLGATTKTFGNLFKVIAFGTKGFDDAQLSVLNLEKDMKRTEATGRLLSGTMRTLGASLLFGGAFALLGFGLEKLLGKMTEARQRAEELRNEFEASKRTYSENADDINKLTREYEYLENQLKNTNLEPELRDERTQRLLEVQEELARLMPDMVIAEDEYGNKIYETAENMRVRNEMLQHQIELENDLKKAQEEEGKLEALKQNQKDVIKNQKEINSNFEKLESLVYKIEGGLQDSSIIDFDITSVEDMNEAMTILMDLRREFVEAGDTDSVAFLDMYLQDFQRVSAQIGAYHQDTIAKNNEIIQTLAEPYQKAIEDNEKLEESARVMLESMTLLLSKAGATPDEATLLLNILEGAVATDEKLNQLSTSYEQSLRRMEQAKEAYDLTPNFANKQKLDQETRLVEENFKLLKQYVMNLFESSGIENSSFFKGMDKELDHFFLKFIDGRGHIEAFADATGKNLQDIQLELQTTGETADEAFESMEQGAGNFAESIAEMNAQLATVGANSLSDIEEMKKAFSDINEHVDYLITTLEVYDDVLSSITEEEYNHIQALIEKGYSAEELTQKELELIRIMEDEEAKILELVQMYPFLISAEDMAKLSKDELIAKIQEEMLAQDLLIGGLELVANGQVTSEERRSIVAFQGTRNRIEQYRQELAALKKLQEAMNQHYRNAVDHYNKVSQLAPGTANEADAEHAAMVARQNLNNVKNNTIDIEIELNSALGEQSKQMTNLQKIQGILSGATSNYGKQVGKANDALNKGTKGTKKNTKAKKDNAKATKTKAEAEEMASFIADKYKRAIEQLTLALKEQQAIKERFPKHSKEYRNALEKEITLEKQKLELMQSQSKELKDNLASGRVPKTGVVTQSQAQTQTTTKPINRKLSGWQARVNSGYGYRVHPISGKRTMHAGVDMAQPLGTRLEANIEGIVKRAFYDKQGYGNVIYVVDNSGKEHRYAHLNKIGVKAGQKVGVGDYLGDIGTTGRSTGPHLHYEVWQNGKHMNPMAWVNAAKQSKTIQTSAKSVQNVTKEVAQGYSDMYDLQSQILGLQGDIIDQQLKIEQLQLEYLRADLATFDKRRSNYDTTINAEIAKYDQLEKVSERYLRVLQRQEQFTKYKLQVNQEELAYLKALINSNVLVGNALEEVTERYKILQIEIRETQIAIQSLRKEQIDAQMNVFARDAELYDYELAKLEQTLRANEAGTNAWNEASKQQLELLRRKRLATRNEIEELTRLLKVTDSLKPDDVQEYQRRLRELTLQYRELGLTIMDANESMKEMEENAWDSIANQVIEAYKKAIQQKQEAHIKSLDKEMEAENERHKKIMDNYRDELNAYREIINEKIKEIDKEDEQRTYDNEMAELDEERAKILREIQLLATDDSREAKYRRKKLQEDLSKIDKTIEDKRYKREKDLRKENLNDLLSDKEKEIQEKEKMENEYHESEKKRIDDLKEYWNQYYTDLLNDERKFAKMREDIMNQNFENIEREFGDLIDYLTETMPDLENTLNGTMEAVGTAIRQNIIDELKNAIQLMYEFDEKIKESNKLGGVDLSEGLGDLPQVDDKTPKLTEGDMQVIVGKLIRHNLAEMIGDTPQEIKRIMELGSDYANEGRQKGSTIDNAISYDDLIQTMDKANTEAFAVALEQYAKTLPFAEHELQDWLYKEAERLRIAASYDTGGLI